MYHYLDDFLILAQPDSQQCNEGLHKLQRVFDKLGVPLAEEKLEGPSVCLTFLEIELDTRRMRRCLPSNKLTELESLIRDWLPRKACKVRELQSLVGKLQHASKEIRPHRTFLRGMLELLRGLRKHQHWVEVNASFKSDLWWWHCFLGEWNGVAMLENNHRDNQEIQLYTDTSGSFGCGAWWDPEWLQLQWPERLEDWSIA